MKDIYSPLEIDEQWDQRAPAAEEGAGTAVLERPTPEATTAQDDATQETTTDNAGAYTFHPDPDGDGGVTSNSGEPTATTVNMSAAETTGELDNSASAQEPEKQPVSDGATPPPEGPSNNLNSPVEAGEYKSGADTDSDAIASLGDSLDNSNTSSQEPAGVTAEPHSDVAEPETADHDTSKVSLSSTPTTSEKVIEPPAETVDSLASEQPKDTTERDASGDDTETHTSDVETAVGTEIDKDVKAIIDRVEQDIAKLEEQNDKDNQTVSETQARVDERTTEINTLKDKLAKLKEVSG